MQDEADQLRKQIQDLNTSIRYYVIHIDDRFLSSHYFVVQSTDNILSLILFLSL